MTWLRDELDIYSKIKYAAWRLSKNRYPVALELKSGAKIILRGRPYRDTEVAHEIFADKIYLPPSGLATSQMNFVLDLGANVGYSCVWWLQKYPHARVMAYEPHPAHVWQLQEHLSLNGWSDRVEVVAKAAAVREGELHLSDDECRSTVVAKSGRSGIPISAADLFADVKHRAIDLLKMDIEGGEHELLADDKFGMLDVNLCVLEWHNTLQQPNSGGWCEARLRRFGFKTYIGHADRNNGILWASRVVNKTSLH